MGGIEVGGSSLCAGVYVWVCVCVCVCVYVGMLTWTWLAQLAKLLFWKAKQRPNSLVHHQPVFQSHDGGGLGNHSRPPTQQRNENNI